LGGGKNATPRDWRGWDTGQGEALLTRNSQSLGIDTDLETCNYTRAKKLSFPHSAARGDKLGIRESIKEVRGGKE